MDAQDLIHSVLRGALGGRRKRSHRALGFLTEGKNSFLSASTLLTLGGLAWGAYEAATRTSDGSAGAEPQAAPPPSGPPLPPTAGHPPPLPPLAGGAAEPAVDSRSLRVVRLTISAARADGTLHDRERQAILEQARAAGAEALVQAELEDPRPLGEILAGISDPNHKQDLYVLAYAIVRADEAVSGAERIYLAQLAHQLGLSAEETRALEELAAARIDAQLEPAGGS